MKRILILSVLLLSLAGTAQAKFLFFGSNVGPGVELRDHNRGLAFATPTSKWKVTTGEKMINFSHAKYYDMFVSLQKSIYRSPFVDRVYESRREGLLEFSPDAQFIENRSEVQIAGTKGLALTYIDPVKKKTVREIYFVYKTTAYQISLSAKKRTYEKLVEEFEYFLKSFEAIPIRKKVKHKSESLDKNQKRSLTNSAGI